jgi:hypothetical protein
MKPMSFTLALGLFALLIIGIPMSLSSVYMDRLIYLSIFGYLFVCLFIVSLEGD